MTVESINNEFRKGRMGEWSYSLLAFEKPTTNAQQLLLKEIGVELLTYLPDNVYQVRMKKLPLFSQLYNAGVRAFVQMPAEAKLGNELIVYLSDNKQEVSTLLNLQLVQGVKWTDVKSKLEGLGVQLTKSDFLNQGLAQVSISSTIIKAVSELPFVAYINLSFLKVQPLNGRERQMFGLTNLTGSQTSGRKLSGSGVFVGVGDDANPSHLDNDDNLINRNPVFISYNHGRLVTGSVIGKGLIVERYGGAAPKAVVIADFYDNILIKSGLYFADYKMTVTNNSYYNGLANCPGNSEYNELSLYADLQMRNNPFLQHIFACGNDGGKTCSPYPASFATIKSGYQVAKNVLDVGDYSIDSDTLNVSSSRGPVKDGRIKPEIVASGYNVVSTSSNNGYAGGYGTSHSAPFVTGVWALLTERYKQIHANSLPKSALLKAIICNTGDDRGNPGPDYNWGFGLINPRKAVEAIEQVRYYSNSITTGTLQSQIIAVPPGTTQVKVMLYWHDKEASPLAPKALVNDLDLTVTDGVTTYQPWILNPSPGTVNNNAVRGIDNINNIEQVTFSNPGSNITIQVNGSTIPTGPQEYFVTYEFLRNEIKLEYPVGGEKIGPATSEVIRWNASDNSNNSFTIEVSLDEGVSWSVINNNVSASTNRYVWIVPNTPTNKGKIRVTRNGTGTTVTMSGTFTILSSPVITVAAPCEGYVNLSWATVTGATDYEVLQVQNGSFLSLGTTTSTSYRVNGLNKTQAYWFTVRARINDSIGIRATARTITPTGSTPCTAAEFDKDLKIDSLLSPLNGRLFTSNALTAAHPVTVRIKNLDDAATSGSYTLTYQINGGAVISEISSAAIAAGGTANYTFTTPANFVVPGTYSVKVTVKQTGDAQTANDEFTYTVRHVANAPVLLPFIETFEAADTSEYKTSFFALNSLPAFDFTTGNNGRLRTFVNSGVAVNGGKAITLDAITYNGTLANNQLSATVNLSNYTAAQGLRFDFNFKNHGQLKQPGTAVWMRGSDVQPWVKIYDLSANQGKPGDTKRISININELGQTLSSSFQIRFDQQSTTSANNATYDLDATDMDDGFTFDDLRIVQTNNDVLLTQLIAPDTFLCNAGATAVTIKVKNTTASVFNNVPVYYRINNGTAVAGSISSLPANSEINYTFTTTADLSVLKAHKIDAWVQLPGDDYPVNDSITNQYVYSSAVVNTFPYLERFNNSNGNWFTDTLSYSSWRWGKPDKSLMNRSASEGKGWYNTLNGGYKQNEIAYLYSPCFNLSGLTQPVLSFSHISQQEDNCNCDYHSLEYSIDNGNNWQRLTAVNGTNWFDSSNNQSWRKSIQRWHVSSTELPNAANIRFRFVLESDELTQYEGAGIDDIHIFDKVTVYTGADVINNNQTVTGNNWVHFNSGGNRIASINPLGQNLGSTDVSVYINTNPVRYMNNQYYLDRNLVISSANAPTDSVLVRLYFTEQEVVRLLSATSCTGCIKLTDAFLAAVTKYSGYASFENGLLNDGTDGTFQFIDSGKVDVVPFNNGYYAEFKVKSFSEFWINAVDMGLTQLVTDVPNVPETGVFIKNVFPDEAGNLMIDVGNKPQVRSITVRIVNSIGQEMKLLQTDYSDTRINISQLPQGIYFVEIRDTKGKEKYTKKITKGKL
ncbi:S8 family serine peptidase [Lacibacter luteus]|nr:S8 family serine peptidase [Lacibacter luteus]